MRRPTTPGKILFHEFIKPSGMSMAELSDASHISLDTIIGIVCGTQEITKDIEEKLFSVFDVSAEYWMNLQRKVDEFDANEHEQQT